MQVDCIDHGYIGDKDGYAITTGRREDGSRFTYRLHRKVAAEYRGLRLSDISGLVVMHTCDNPRCINPEHLSLGTNRDNQKDKVNKNRQAKREAHGRSVLTVADVGYIKSVYTKGSREYGAPALARKFNVHPATVYSILYGQNWAT